MWGADAAARYELAYQLMGGRPLTSDIMQNLCRKFGDVSLLNCFVGVTLPPPPPPRAHHEVCEDCGSASSAAAPRKPAPAPAPLAPKPAPAAPVATAPPPAAVPQPTRESATPPEPPRSKTPPPPAAAAPAPLRQVPPPSYSPRQLEALKEGALVFSEMGEQHESALAYMRWRRDAAVAANQTIAPSAEMAADTRLLRFLVAHAWDGVAAADAYIGALKWRRDAKADETRDRIVGLNGGFFVDGAPALSEISIFEHDAALQALQPRTFTRRTAAGYEPLYDRLGNMVYIECPGLVDNAGIAKLGASAAQQSFFGNIELGVLILDELSRRQGRLVLMCRVMDMVGLKLVNPFKSKDEKEGERAFKEASGQVRETYPTTTYKNFLINLPAASAAGPIVKAFAPARSAKKFVMLGGKYQDELHREVEPAMLPRRLGGELDDGLQWKRAK